MDGLQSAQGGLPLDSSLISRYLNPKTISHQLIVIGNGFDLACGLESDFEDFFTPRMEALKACRKRQGDARFEQMAASGLTAWDIVLSASYPGFARKGRVDWCDVEGAIERVVRPARFSTEDAAYRFLDVRLAREAIAEAIDEDGTPLNPLSHGTPLNPLSQKLLGLDRNGAETKELARYLLWKHPDRDDWSLHAVLQLLLGELGLLEGEFDGYLSAVVGGSDSYKARSAALLRDLVAAENPLLEDADEVRTTVLSFNYTDPGEIGLAGRAIGETVHVHGRLGQGIVFGIDGTDCMDDPDALCYTKTYRLLGAATSHPISPVAYPPSRMPGDVETAAIKFYGHSLAKADYAYFQSMFDITELYGGNVTLCFYYSDYCPEERERTYRRVSNLLAFYGKTMENKDHGKNLIHKLLLENRLVIRSL